jgi:hypothetical protein
MWGVLQLAHLLFPLWAYTAFFLFMYIDDSETWTLLFGQPRWWVVVLILAFVPLLYGLALWVRRRTARPSLRPRYRKLLRGAALTIWAFASMSVLPAWDDSGIAGAALWAGVAAFSFWLAWRLERLGADRPARPATAH